MDCLYGRKREKTCLILLTGLVLGYRAQARFSLYNTSKHNMLPLMMTFKNTSRLLLLYFYISVERAIIELINEAWHYMNAVKLVNLNLNTGQAAQLMCPGA